MWGRLRNSAASEDEIEAFVIKWPRGFHQPFENVLGQAIRYQCTSRHLGRSAYTQGLQGSETGRFDMKVANVSMIRL